VRAGIVSLLTALLLLAGITYRSARAGEKPRVLLVGIDAGEWDVLGPLLDRGQCPNFAKLRARGSAGKLRSLIPLTRSPVIWATIATGKTPEKHGVLDFLVRAERPDAEAPPGKKRTNERPRPMTSNLWKARPVWRILSGLGHTVGVVGWWTTWPAQAVNGDLVSDYVQYDSQWSQAASRLTYPDSLTPMVRRLRRTAVSVSWAEVFQFVAPIDTTHVTERQKAIVENLKLFYAADMTFYRVGMELYRKRHPDFFTVYFRGVDEISHMYWDAATDRHFDPPLSPAELAWIRPLIPNYYIFTDRLMGDFVKEAGANTDVIVCSDHGFGGGGTGVMAHKPDGIIFMAGPHMVKGGTITGATVMDITPTILAALGLPTARDMDGRPIPGGLQTAVVKRMEREDRLPTYETARSEGEKEEPLRSPVDDELRERLRSLGYIQ
jgi:predicted AlkP superfamily phosphohydrolase/phosphomutase